MIRMFQLIVLIGCVTLFGTGLWVETAEAQSSDDEEAVQDDAYPDRRKSDETWETIVSLPGKLVALPIKLVLKGISGTAAYFDDTNFVPKVIDFLTSDDGRRGVMPVYAARTGGGINFYQAGLFTPRSLLNLEATVGPRSRQRFSLSLKGLSIGNRIRFGLNAHHQFLSNESFYGLGNDSDKSDESNYGHKQTAIEMPLGVEFGKAVIDASIGYQSNQIEAGRDRSLPSTTDVFTLDELPGLGPELDLTVFQLTMKYDGRNHPGHPTAGWQFQASGAKYTQVDKDDFGFWKTYAKIDKYLNLFYERVLVMSLTAELTQPTSGNQIPFYYQSEIGRDETVRGFRRGRFRLNDAIIGSLEYRYPIWRIFDATIFVDAGKVSDDIFNDSLTDDFHVGFGGGIRIWGPRGLLAKVELGKSKDGYRLYLVLNN